MCQVRPGARPLSRRPTSERAIDVGFVLPTAAGTSVARRSFMRTVLAAVAFVFLGCTTAAEPTPGEARESEQDAPIGPTPEQVGGGGGGGGLPPRLCGEPEVGASVGCGRLMMQDDRYCSELRFGHPQMPGTCLAPLSTGELTAEVDGETFTATHVAARPVGGGILLEIVGLIGPSAPGEAERGIRILAAGSLAGDRACGGETGTSITLSEQHAERSGIDDAVAYGPNGECSISVASASAAGTIVEGTFSATLAGTKTIAVTNGRFAIRLTD